MNELLAHTKAIIVASCVKPKTWSELKEITKKTDPTLAAHLNDLQHSGTIKKGKDGRYGIKDIDYAVKLLELLIHENINEMQHLLLAKARIEEFRVN